MGTESAADHARQRRRLRADDRDLLDRREVEVERLQQVREGLRVACRHLVEQPEDAVPPRLVIVLARQGGQPQKTVGRARAARRDRVVLQALATDDQPLAFDGRLGDLRLPVLGIVLKRLPRSLGDLGEGV